MTVGMSRRSSSQGFGGTQQNIDALINTVKSLITAVDNGIAEMRQMQARHSRPGGTSKATKRARGSAASNGKRGASTTPPPGKRTREVAPPEQCSPLECIKRVLSTLLADSRHKAFARPVDPVYDGVPDYWDVIERPLDLATVMQRIEAKIITSLEQAFADIHQVWKNATSYWPANTRLHIQAQKAANQVDKMLLSSLSTHCRKEDISHLSTTCDQSLINTLHDMAPSLQEEALRREREEGLIPMSNKRLEELVQNMEPLLESEEVLERLRDIVEKDPLVPNIDELEDINPANLTHKTQWQLWFLAEDLKSQLRDEAAVHATTEEEGGVEEEGEEEEEVPQDEGVPVIMTTDDDEGNGEEAHDEVPPPAVEGGGPVKPVGEPAQKGTAPADVPQVEQPAPAEKADQAPAAKVEQGTTGWAATWEPVLLKGQTPQRKEENVAPAVKPTLPSVMKQPVNPEEEEKQAKLHIDKQWKKIESDFQSSDPDTEHLLGEALNDWDKDPEGARLDRVDLFRSLSNIPSPMASTLTAPSPAWGNSGSGSEVLAAQSPAWGSGKVQAPTADQTLPSLTMPSPGYTPNFGDGSRGDLGALALPSPAYGLQESTAAQPGPLVEADREE